MPKNIDPEVKARALRMLAEHGGEYSSTTAAAAAIAKKLGVGRETVRRWAVQAEVDAGRRPGASSAELAELKRVKAENKRLREDIEVLEAATSFFVGEPDPRNR
ncbi:hypothetical protein GYA93_16940 [Gordonia desulfuricans]|uniref:Transposase n=1 Tax=Gordonia desulfuricans TaxID=89051 RepID=A0A7K3LSJ1_9ACTN|nr:hypothetical protein [Gordonia desulfuricans]NDK91254.1 hypothetical protein [Gordonia desulfuricans]